MHFVGFYYKNTSRCTVLLMSNYTNFFSPLRKVTAMCTFCCLLSANLQDSTASPVLKTYKIWNDIAASHHHINNFKKIKHNTSLNFNNVTHLLFFFQFHISVYQLPMVNFLIWQFQSSKVTSANTSSPNKSLAFV